VRKEAAIRRKFAPITVAGMRVGSVWPRYNGCRND
jgi:hypothetical protein